MGTAFALEAATVAAPGGVGAMYVAGARGFDGGSSVAGAAITLGNFGVGSVVDAGFAVYDVAKGFQPVPFTGGYYVGTGRVEPTAGGRTVTAPSSGYFPNSPAGGAGTLSGGGANNAVLGGVSGFAPGRNP
jgi:hypothetical protein